MAEALRDCMVQQECMRDGTRTLKECLRLQEFHHECQVRKALNSIENTKFPDIFFFFSDQKESSRGVFRM